MGGAIKVAFSYLEESYEPTRSVRMHAYAGEKQQVSGIRHYSNLRFVSFVHIGTRPVSGVTMNSIRSLCVWGEGSMEIHTTFDSTLDLRWGRGWANGQHGRFRSEKPGVSKGHCFLFCFFFLSPLPFRWNGKKGAEKKLFSTLC